MPSIDCLDSESPRHCKDAKACTKNKTLSLNAHQLRDMIILYCTSTPLLSMDNAANINQNTAKFDIVIEFVTHEKQA